LEHASDFSSAAFAALVRVAFAQEMGPGLKLVLLLLGCAWSLSAANYYIVISGLGGTPEYETQFGKWAADLGQELRKNGTGAEVTVLSGAAVSKAKVKDAFARLTAQVKSDDAFALLLIGHGSFDGTDYKFNIPGPDLSAAEIALLLDTIPASRQVIIDMTSCSGASLPVLAHRGRVVVTATKSGTEKNATLFPRFFIDALRDSAADMDKNGAISLLEAFRYTEHKLSGYYESEKLLASEHPLLGGERAPEDGSREAQLAAAFPLIRPENDNLAQASPERQSLLHRKQDLEAKIDRLKYQKSAMDEQEYKQQLGSLLLELARTQAEIDR
jgi:hypothetical protein